MNINWLYQWEVNIGSGNGLVPSGNKPLHEPLLTQIYAVEMLFTYVMRQISIHDYNKVSSGVLQAMDVGCTWKQIYTTYSIKYNPCHIETIYVTYKYICIFYHFLPKIVQVLENWNPSQWRTRTFLTCIINTTGADDLAARGARACVLSLP